MRAAIYARYSSENQRPESITDQIYSCRKYATEHGWTVDDALIFSDEAVSGAREDRAGLHEMMEAARGATFDALLVDDCPVSHETTC
jgi:site-specific DNA recombinase